jgi:hypothetical protein
VFAKKAWSLPWVLLTPANIQAVRLKQPQDFLIAETTTNRKAPS